MVSDTPKFIDFNGVDRFDSIVSSYLVNLYNYMKTKVKEIQVDLFIPLIGCKYGKKIKGQEIQVTQLMTFKFGKSTKKMKYLKYLFSWRGRF